MDVRIVATGYGIGIATRTMPTTTSAEQSLINDSEFLDELGQFSAAGKEPPAFARDGVAGAVPPDERRRPYGDAFDALDGGLAIDGDAPGPVSPRGDGDPIEEPHVPPANLSAPERRGIPFITAALVLVTCLTAGAATAAYLFRDQLTHITARPSATR
jgi:hypothetical protein